MATDMTVTIDDIRATADRLAGQVVATPTVRSAALSERNGAEVYLELESLQRTGRVARLRDLVPDEPGHLARVATEISASRANIVAVYHQRMVHDIPVKETELDVVVETRDDAHIRQLLERLAKAGFDVRRLRDTARQEQPGIE